MSGGFLVWDVATLPFREALSGRLSASVGPWYAGYPPRTLRPSESRAGESVSSARDERHEERPRRRSGVSLTSCDVSPARETRGACLGALASAQSFFVPQIVAT